MVELSNNMFGGVVEEHRMDVFAYEREKDLRALRMDTYLELISETGKIKRDINWELWVIPHEIKSICANITHQELIYWYQNNIRNRPICKCGIELEFIQSKKKYPKSCSKICARSK